VRDCRTLVDFVAAPASRKTVIVVADVPLGTPEAIAVSRVTRGIQEARRELDRLEGLLQAYGASPFVPEYENVANFSCGGEGQTRHSVLMSVFDWTERHGLMLVRAGDQRVERVSGKNYTLAESVEA
jgi:hypothetical protein